MIKNLMMLLVFSVFMFSGCSLEPKPIEYGEDQCDACKMRISDSRFGAELVTTKGKIYKYDAMFRAHHAETPIWRT